MKRATYCTLLAALISCGALAADPTPSMRLSMRYHLAPPDRTGRGMATVFTGEPLIADVAVNFVRLPNPSPGGPPPTAYLKLPSAAWWTAIQWSLIDSKGTARAVNRNPRVLEDKSVWRHEVTRPREGFVIVEGERPAVTLDLGPLPAGDYTLSASFLSMKASPLPFSVRRGDETPEVRRAFLRYTLNSQPRTYPEAKAIYSELAKLEPDNAGNLKDLASMALQYGPPEDAASAYAQARAIVAANREQQVAKDKKLAPQLEEAFERELTKLANLRAMADAVVQSHGTLTVKVQGFSAETRQYELVERGSGHIVRMIHE